MISGHFTHNKCFRGAGRLRRLTCGQESNQSPDDSPFLSVSLSFWSPFHPIIKLKESNHLPEIRLRNCLENNIHKSCWSWSRWFSLENCCFISVSALCVRWSLVHFVGGALGAESSLHVVWMLDPGCACLIGQLFSCGVVRVGGSRAVWWVGDSYVVLQTNGKHIFYNQEINMVIARQKRRK